MKEQYKFSNMTTEDFLDVIENMIITNPEMDGVELEDSVGRVWFITLTSEARTLN